MSLPDFHPLFLAFKAKNKRAIRYLIKFSDALACLHRFNKMEPLLIELAGCNSDDLFAECMIEWTKWVREKEPHNYRFLDIKLKDSTKMNLLHHMA